MCHELVSRLVIVFCLFFYNNLGYFFPGVDHNEEEVPKINREQLPGFITIPLTLSKRRQTDGFLYFILAIRL